MWKVSKYGPEKTQYFDTFHTVKVYSQTVATANKQYKTLFSNVTSNNSDTLRKFLYNTVHNFLEFIAANY